MSAGRQKSGKGGSKGGKARPRALTAEQEEVQSPNRTAASRGGLPPLPGAPRGTAASKGKGKEVTPAIQV